MLEHKPLLIFDFDGTLYHSKPAVIASFQKTMVHFGYPKPCSERLVQLYQKGLDLATTLNHLAPNVSQEQHTLQMKHYLQIHLKDIVELGHWYEGAKEALDALRHDFHLIIASNRNQKTLDPIITHHQITHWFSAILGTSIGHPFKPSKELFLQELPSELHQHPVRAVIGDTMVDCKFAQALDCDFYWADYGYGHRPVIMNHLSSIKELPQLL